MNEQHHHILVVDDDARLRDLLTRYLGEQGFEVKAAADGQQMDKLRAREHYHLIVLDLMMPNLDGFETLRTIRSHPDLSDLPVIIATSKELSRSELAWLRAHAGDVVSKGQNGRASLVAAIRRNVAQGAARADTTAADLPQPRGETR